MSCKHASVHPWNGGWYCDECNTYYETDPQKAGLERRLADVEAKLAHVLNQLGG